MIAAIASIWAYLGEGSFLTMHSLVLIYILLGLTLGAEPQLGAFGPASEPLRTKKSGAAYGGIPFKCEPRAGFCWPGLRRHSFSSAPLLHFTCSRQRLHSPHRLFWNCTGGLSTHLTEFDFASNVMSVHSLGNAVHGKPDPRRSDSSSKSRRRSHRGRWPGFVWRL